MTDAEVVAAQDWFQELLLATRDEKAERAAVLGIRLAGAVRDARRAVVLPALVAKAVALSLEPVPGERSPEEEAAARTADLEAFAKLLGVEYDPRGTIGIGRPCVGFKWGGSYVGYDGVDGAYPGDAVPDAYHKGDYLAVCAEDDNDAGYLKAAVQLARWVEALKRAGLTAVESRRPDPHSFAAVLGRVEWRLCRRP